MKHRALPPAIATLCLGVLLLPSGSSGSDTRQAPLAEPKTALDWFRRANDLTNIRHARLRAVPSQGDVSRVSGL